MRINLQSDYALRLMMQLAVNPDTLVSISEVATSFGISKNHLMKVAHSLRQKGYIETVRGRAGGLRLARSPDQINVGAVIRDLEADFALVECFPGGADQCKITPVCQLKHVLQNALDAFFDVLDQSTIADLIDDNAGLTDLLRL